MNKYPYISVCIPAYNRSEVLPELLESILCQKYKNFEIIICEDFSPQRLKIREISEKYISHYPGFIRYFENDENKGYDANYRHIFNIAKGEYCFFMGNDDLVCEDALEVLANVLHEYPNIGVVVRSYADFKDDPKIINQIYRYFKSQIYIPPGEKAISTAFRRSVIGSGMVYHRQSAIECQTEKFDGTLLYQLHVVANTLRKKGVVFVPQVTVLYRLGGVPDFGNAESEKGKFTPKEQTIESSLKFMEGMLQIARSAEDDLGLKVYKSIISDINNYSYPILSIQARRSKTEFIGYVYRLLLMGLGRKTIFFVYVALILIMGPDRLDLYIKFIKRKLGYTPSFGRMLTRG